MMRDNRKINIQTDFFDDQQCVYLYGQEPTAPDSLLRKDQAVITIYNALDTIRLQRLINGFNSISSAFRFKIKLPRQNLVLNKLQHKKAKTNQPIIHRSNFIRDSEPQQTYQMKSGRSQHKKKSQSMDDKYSKNNNYFREQRRKILNSIAKTLSQHEEERSLSNSKNKQKHTNIKLNVSSKKPQQHFPQPVKKEQNLQINHRIQRLQRLMNNIRREKQTKQPIIVHQKKIIAAMPKKDKSKQHLRIFVQQLQSIRKQVGQIKKMNKQILHHSQSRASHSSNSSRVRREQESYYNTNNNVNKQKQILRSEALQNIRRSQQVQRKNIVQNKSQKVSKGKQLYNSAKKSDYQHQKFHPKQKLRQQPQSRQRSQGRSKQKQQDINLYNNSTYQHRSLVQSDFKNTLQKQKNQKMQQNQRQNTWQHISQLQKPSSLPLSQQTKQRQNIQIIQQKEEQPHLMQDKRIMANNPLLGSPKILNMNNISYQKNNKQEKVGSINTANPQIARSIHNNANINTNTNQHANTANKLTTPHTQQVKRQLPQQIVPKIDLKSLNQAKNQQNPHIRIQPKYQQYTPDPNSNNIYRPNSYAINNNNIIAQNVTNINTDKYPHHEIYTNNNMHVYHNNQAIEYKHRLGEVRQTFSLSHNSKFNSVGNSPSSSAFSYKDPLSHRQYAYSYREFNHRVQKPHSIQTIQNVKTQPRNSVQGISFAKPDSNPNINNAKDRSEYSLNKADYNFFYNKYSQSQLPNTDPVNYNMTKHLNTQTYEYKSNNANTNANSYITNSINKSNEYNSNNSNNDAYRINKHQFSSEQIPRNNNPPSSTSVNKFSPEPASDYTDPSIMRMFNIGSYRKAQQNQQQYSHTNNFLKFKQTVESVLDDDTSQNTISMNIKSNNDKPNPSTRTFSDNFTYKYSKDSSKPTSLAKLQQQYMNVINNDLNQNQQERQPRNHPYAQARFGSNQQATTQNPIGMRKKSSLQQMVIQYNARSAEKVSPPVEYQTYQQKHKYGGRYQNNQGYR